MSKRPYTAEEDQEILRIAEASKQSVGGNIIWQTESAQNKVNFEIFFSALSTPITTRLYFQ